MYVCTTPGLHTGAACLAPLSFLNKACCRVRPLAATFVTRQRVMGFKRRVSELLDTRRMKSNRFPPSGSLYYENSRVRNVEA